MNLRTFAALSILLPAPLVFAADGTFEKTLGLNGVPAVSVATGSGYVHVYPGPDNQVHVTGHVHVRTSLFNNSDSDSRIKHMVDSPPITQSGNTITIGTEHQNSELFENVSIDYDVRVPAASALKASAGSGPIEIGGIQGQVTAHSGSGAIHAENLGPDARLGTGSGSIRIGGVSGGLQANAGSGSIDVAGNPSSEWRIQSGSGSIHLHLASNTHFTLSARTGSGSVHVELPIMMQGDLNRHEVSGTVNGGGPMVHASTGSGSITVQ